MHKLLQELLRGCP